MRLGTARNAGRKRDMSQPLQGTIKPRRPTRLAATDLHWMWWLNVRSLNLLDQGLAEVPYLWPEGDGKRLRLYLEAVSEEEGIVPIRLAQTATTCRRLPFISMLPHTHP